ncbi:hypothetical protein CsSME_00015112 [Camellia sinensis var. sinensis]
MLAQVQLPLEDTENDARHYNDDHFDFGEFGYTNDKGFLVGGTIKNGQISPTLDLLIKWVNKYMN